MLGHRHAVSVSLDLKGDFELVGRAILKRCLSPESLPQKFMQADKVDFIFTVILQ